MDLTIKNIKGENFIVINSDILTLTDYIGNDFEVFFIPTNKVDFEFATNEEFEYDELFPFEIIEDEVSFEYLVKINENKFVDLPLLCDGKEAIRIGHEVNFLEKLIDSVESNIQDLSNLLVNCNGNKKRYLVSLFNNNKELLTFLKNIKSLN